MEADFAPDFQNLMNKVAAILYRTAHLAGNRALESGRIYRETAFTDLGNLAHSPRNTCSSRKFGFVIVLTLPTAKAGAGGARVFHRPRFHSKPEVQSQTSRILLLIVTQ